MLRYADDMLLAGDGRHAAAADAADVICCAR